jgi:hypothetical protein
MFQNWISIQDFVTERQKDLLREAEAARIREGLMKSAARKPVRPKGAGARSAGDVSARGSCLDCPGHVGAVQA